MAPTIAAEIAESIVDRLRSGGKVLIAGNGGSTADAQRPAAEFVSCFHDGRPGLPGFAPGDVFWGTKRSNLCIAAPPTETPMIQKAHMLAGHIVSGLAEATLYPPL